MSWARTFVVQGTGHAIFEVTNVQNGRFDLNIASTGVMHVLPTNQSTHGVCIEPGHSFEGYYRPARLVDPKDKEKMEVEPRSRIDAE